MSERALHGHEPFADENAGFTYFATAPHCARLADGVYNHLANTRGIALVSGRLLPRAAVLLNHFPSLGSHSTILDCPSGVTFGDLMNLYAASLETGAHFVDDGRQWPTASAHLPRSGSLPILVLENADRLSDEGLVELNRSYTDVSRPLLVLTGADGFFRRLESAAADLVGSGSFAHFPVEHLAPEEVAAFISFQMGADESGAAVFRPEIIGLVSAYADGDPVAVNRLARRILNVARPPAEDRLGSVPEGGRADVVEVAPAAVLGANEATNPFAYMAETGESLGAALGEQPSALIAAELVTTMAPQPGSAEPDLPAAAEPLGTTPVLVSIDVEIEAAPLAVPNVDDSGEGRAAAAIEIIADLVPENAPSEIRLPNEIDPAAVGTLARDAVAPVEGEAADADDLGARGLEVDDASALTAEGSEGPPVSQTGSGTAPDEGLDDDWDDARSVPDLARPSYPVGAHRGGRLVGWIAACLAILMVSGGALRYVLDAQQPQSAAPVVSVSASVQERLDPRPIPVARTLDKPTDPPPAIAPAPSAAAVVSVLKESEQPIAGSGTTAAEGSKSPKPLDEPKPPAGPIETTQAAQPLSAESAKTEVKSKPTMPPRESVAMVEPPTIVPPADPAPELAKPETRPAAAATDAEEIALLLQRGDQLLSTGDIASARRFFERAADRGNGTAATRLAKTYDPLYLQRAGVRGALGDPSKAFAWYRKAISGGDIEAEMRLQQLRAKFPE